MSSRIIPARMRHGEFAANGIEAAIDSDRGVEERLTFPDPLFVSPVESADCGGSGVVAVLPQSEFTGHAANLADRRSC